MRGRQTTPGNLFYQLLSTYFRPPRRLAALRASYNAGTTEVEADGKKCG